MSEQIKNRSLLVQPLQDISLSKVIPEIHRQATTKSQKKLLSYDPSPLLYMTIFGLWGLCLLWFQPRLWSLMVIPESVPAQAVLLFFILFIDLAWLYGLYNVCVVIFALIHRYTASRPESALTKASLLEYPAVALLYTTCNDFIEASVQSCVDQDYPNYTVYILDDSAGSDYRQRVDNFAAKYPGLVKVIRRSDRRAFKAGNMNHGLAEAAKEEPYFAIADADEILPTDFLSKLIPVLEADPNCGFVQANHRANPHAESKLARDLGIGIDIHWKWYQPLRNDYGFVMFLGHGAVLRRKCWEEIGGFPEIVSEDLGFAIRVREKGYRGRFVEDVVCFEDFPDTVRSFRIRHMKWTRGTSEFLKKEMAWLLRAKNITWTEKFDILFPTLNLPLTLLYFLFMVNANLLLPYFFGKAQDLTLAIGSTDLVMPIYIMDDRFELIYSSDFFAITMLTFFAPVLCFILALVFRPIRLFRFLAHSTALYAALGPLSSIGVLAYAVSGKAIFLVTGDQQQAIHQQSKGFSSRWASIKKGWQQFLAKSHPDAWIVKSFEIVTGVVFAVACVFMFQISFFGLCLSFLLLPVMHHLGWENRWIKKIVYLPFILILLGVGLAGLSLFGMQTVFFGYGFHF